MYYNTVWYVFRWTRIKENLAFILILLERYSFNFNFREMEGNQTCCSLGSMFVLVVLVLLPVKSQCIDETYRSMREVNCSHSSTPPPSHCNRISPYFCLLSAKWRCRTEEVWRRLREFCGSNGEKRHWCSSQWVLNPHIIPENETLCYSTFLQRKCGKT